MWEILNFKWFFVTENSNKFPKKPGFFGRKNQLKTWLTLRPMAQATLVVNEKNAIFLLIFGDHYLIYHVQWVSLRKIFITWWLKNKFLKKMLSHTQGSNSQNFENKIGEINLLPVSIDCFIRGSLSLGMYIVWTSLTLIVAT
jgi:hypothetical protein